MTEFLPFGPNQSLTPLIEKLQSRRRFLGQWLGVGTAALWSPTTLLAGPASGQAALFGKPDLRVLTEQPLNAEAWPHDLDAEVTPSSALFVRNNGKIPDFALRQDSSRWQLLIDGEVERAKVFSLTDLTTRFKQYSYNLVLECGGNGRAAFYPPTPGLQWTYGAVGCPRWDGVLLRDVLAEVGVKRSAVYVGYYGHDEHLSGEAGAVVISRGFPIAKALHPMTMIATGLNGRPLPAVHGFPARLICPGYPASASGKWLKRLWIRDRVHDGAKMEGYSYRMPSYPIAPGGEIPASAMQIIEAMPVRSLITSPRSNLQHTLGKNKPLNCRGFAWSGGGEVTMVDVSLDFGQTWRRTELAKPSNPFAWQRWSINLHIPQRGYYELWARAQDASGSVQPLVVPGWNPHGYLNNASARISLNVV